ncbi:UNVERIFIED_ORG: hypothetical protein J2X74_006103 [Bacillus sp. 1751]|nr:hypothetical protein [Bacillus sp. 1751]
MKKRTLNYLGITAILLLVFSPIIINLIVKSKPWFGVKAADNNDWIGFYGSYIGGIITLVALVVTIRYTTQQYNDQDRKRVQPYITLKQMNIKFSSDYKNIIEPADFKVPEINVNHLGQSTEEMEFEKDEKDVYLKYIILYGDAINIGLGTAVNIKFHDIYIENTKIPFIFGNHSYHAIAVGDSIDFMFMLKSVVIENNSLSDEFRDMFENTGYPELDMFFSIRFEDLLGNKYVQQVKVRIQGEFFSNPAGIFAYDTYSSLKKIIPPTLQLSK